MERHVSPAQYEEEKEFLSAGKACRAIPLLAYPLHKTTKSSYSAGLLEEGTLISL